MPSLLRARKVVTMHQAHLRDGFGKWRLTLGRTAWTWCVRGNEGAERARRRACMDARHSSSLQRIVSGSAGGVLSPACPAQWARWRQHVRTWCLLWPTTGRLRSTCGQVAPTPESSFSSPKPSPKGSLRATRSGSGTRATSCVLVPLILTRGHTRERAVDELRGGARR